MIWVKESLCKYYSVFFFVEMRNFKIGGVILSKYRNLNNNRKDRVKKIWFISK